VTTEELVEKLTELGISGPNAEGFRDMHINACAQTGQEFKIPVLTPDDKMYLIKGRFTGENQDFVPEWISVEGP
jgi:hypothetical protein